MQNKTNSSCVPGSQVSCSPMASSRAADQGVLLLQTKEMPICLGLKCPCQLECSQEKDTTGLIDTMRLHPLGPKRTSRIHKLPSLSKDDERQYVVKKPLNKEGKKPRTKAPKTRHPVTPRVL